MIELNSPLQIEPDPQGGWRLVLWMGEAFDYETPFRETLATIAEALGRECHLDLPAHEANEDFVEGTLWLRAVPIRVYYEHSLSHLDFRCSTEGILQDLYDCLKRLVTIVYKSH